MAPHSSILAWKIPWTEEPGRLQSMGSLRVGQDWATSLSLFTFTHWRRKWQPTPVFLPGESQGRGAWWAAVYGVAQSRTWLKRLSSSSSSMEMKLESKFEQFSYLSSKMGCTVARHLAPSTTPLLQELLMNIQCSGVQCKKFCKSWEPWSWGAQWLDIRSWQWQLRAIIEPNPLTTAWEVGKELNVNHSTVVWHLKQTAKVRKLSKWVPHELSRNF